MRKHVFKGRKWILAVLFMLLGASASFGYGDGDVSIWYDKAQGKIYVQFNNCVQPDNDCWDVMRRMLVHVDGTTYYNRDWGNEWIASGVAFGEWGSENMDGIYDYTLIGVPVKSDWYGRTIEAKGEYHFEHRTERLVGSSCKNHSWNDGTRTLKLNISYDWGNLSNFSASTNYSNKITLKWTNPSITNGVSWENQVVRDGNVIATIGHNSSYTDYCGSNKYHRYKIRTIVHAGDGDKQRESEEKIGYAFSGQRVTGLTSEFNKCEGEVQLNWSRYAGHPWARGFQVLRLTEGGAWDVLNDDQLLSTSSTNYTDGTVEHDKNYTYKVRVLWSKSEISPLDSDTTKEYIDLTPKLPLEPEISETVGEDENLKLVVSWDYACDITSKLTLWKRNENTQTTEQIPLDLSKSSYEDKDVKLCTPYKYKLVVENIHGQKGSEYTPYTIMQDIADAMKTFKASKGYYSNKVKLDWSAIKTNLIEQYEISRRKYGTDKPWELVKIIDNGNSFTWIDENTDPGVYYEYQIVGTGDCGDAQNRSNELTTIGFRMPQGIVSGQVNYEGGVAVKDVRVSMEASGDGQVLGSCLQLNGTDSLKIAKENLPDLSAGFTAEAWINPQGLNPGATIFQQGTSTTGIALTYSSSTNALDFSVSGSKLSYSVADKEVWEDGEWNHVAVSVQSGTAYLYINGEKVATKPGVSMGAVNNDLLMGIGLSGYMDEIRLWKGSAHTEEEIARDYTRILSGEEKGLAAYWRLDENLGEFIFDCSKTVDEFNDVHGSIVGAEWSDAIPPVTKLALCGVTDEFGNYLIKGVRYTGSGETFILTPSFGQHSFEPRNRAAFIGDGALVYSSQNFKDISSFQVTGNVKYKGTLFPVGKVDILVDGKGVIGPDNRPVVTDELGNFKVQVPIGEHFISFSKFGHDFENGYWPGINEDESIKKFNFQKAESNLQILDTTKVKLVGRIVGGKVEADKPIGFGLSKNNLGVSTISLKSEKGYDIDLDEHNFIDLKTNSETGEYVAYLIPEKFVVTKVGNTPYSFDGVDDLSVIDLRTCFTESEEVYEDKIFTYNKQRDWIYREKPTVDVKGIAENPIFSETEIEVEDENGKKEKVALVDDENNHLFGYPIFCMNNRYQTKISVFEKYVNADNGAIDQVPVSDGVVIINNSLAKDKSQQEIELDEDGVVDYVFFGGFPNISEDNSKPSFTNTLTVDVKSGPNLEISSAWPSNGEPFRGYCFGPRPTGNNFVTTGPAVNLMVLRDPPGSNSYASYSKGSSFASNMSFGTSDAMNEGKSLNVSVGATVRFGGGLAGPQVELETTNDNEIGMEVSKTCTSNTSMSYSVTTTKTWTTSPEPEYVGAMGDVFIGYSTNIVFGKSTLITLVKDGDKYVVGKDVGFRMSPEFQTTYQYSANHIENYLIPNLEMLRNDFLKRNSGESKGYKSKVDEDDPRYATSNTDKLVWGTQAVDKENFNDGPSYTYKPETETSIDVTKNEEKDREEVAVKGIDSVHFYNQQIQLWKDLLAANEQEKLRAKKTENISFDAGTIYSSETSFEKTESQEFSYEFSMTKSVATSLGFTANGVGAVASLNMNTQSTSSSSTGTDVSEFQTFAFELVDADAGDYYSVDICDPKSNNGPVFRTKGGQTSCPYEGATLTKYYRPGEEISAATMAIEAPEIEVENAIAAEIPESQPAYFTLKLRNNSETGDDNWFQLEADSRSIKGGAKLRVDGGSLNSGVAVLVPAGQTVTKVVELEKGSVDDYENINIILHSQCQFDPTDDLEDISDTATISAYFIPACTEVSIKEPKDNWVVNVANKDTLSIKIADYNLQDDFDNIALQYKPAASGNWVTFMNFFNNDSIYAAYDGDKERIDGRSQINYQWDMTSLQDRSYQIRAVSKCSNGSINESEILTGVLDGKRPKLFGTPQPADGVLSPNDEIMIQFDEEIEAGLVTNYNFSVQGILNSNELNHGASLQFDGENNFATTGEGIQINEKSFSVEFWMQKGLNDGGTVFSQGKVDSEQFKIGFDADKLVISINGEEYSKAMPIHDENWHHWAIGYDISRQAVYAYEDDQVVFDKSAKVYTGEGKVLIGKNPMAMSGFFKGNIHELRVWTKPLTLSEIASQMNISLTGYERGLIGYWPMNEAYGELAEDKVHSRHAEVYADWLVLPRSSSYSFNGGDQALSYSTGTIPVSSDMDFTLELWFNAESDAHGTCIFSNGNPEQTDVESTWTIGFNAEGELVAENNNALLTAAPKGFTDGNWHHFALVMNRLGNLTCYIDGEKQGASQAAGFGSFASPKCFVGARGYVADGGVVSFDKHFKGHVDEIRFWNLARKQEQLKRYMNHKLENDASGLMAYFPFESYRSNSGVMVSTTTLADQSVDEYSETGESHCGTIEVAGALSYGDITPNIKRLLPKQSLNYSFAINEDKIIITPTDPASMLEKSTIEITVKGIEDIHGNRMASPISWSAFVDKNQVRWEEERRSFEKELFAPLTYTTTIRNTGGRQERFSIENLPSWLTANPQSGIIDPVSSMDIEFTVAEGLNIGNYNQDIYLHTNLGFDEKFLLNLRVYKPGPDWVVDRSKYQNSINVIGQIKVDGTVSTDKYDQVAAFIDNECRGVSNLEYIPEYDSYMAFLDIFANTDGKEIKLKVWDASEGLVYSDVAPKLVFQSNEIHGMPSAPVTFEVSNEVEQEIALQSGWNWISFNMHSNLFSHVSEVMAPLAISEGDLIKSGDGKFELFSNGNWGGTISKVGDKGEGIVSDKMYMMKLGQADTLVMRGAIVDPASVDIKLKSGWNWIGFLPSTNMEINEALANFNPQTGDVIKSQRAFAYYDANLGWMGTLKYLKPGEGYLFKSQQEVSFNYPSKSFLKSELIEESFPVVEGASKYENNMPAIIEVVASEADAIDQNFVLAAYSNGEVRGIAQPSVHAVNNGKLFFMTLYGNNVDEELTFKLKYQDQSWETSDIISFNSNEVKGSVQSPYPLTFSLAGLDKNGNEAINSFDAGVHPNPMDNELTISVQQMEEAECDIKIYNSFGQLVTVVFSGTLKGGYSTFLWNGESANGEVPVGIYFVVVRSADDLKTLKVIRK